MTLQTFLKTHPKKRLIFDFDDTIVKLHLPWDIWKEEIRTRLSTIDKAFVQKNTSLHTTDLINLSVSKFGNEAKKITDEYSEYFETELLRGLTVHEELASFIKEHAEDYEMYIWSSNMKTTIENGLDSFNLLYCFKQIISRNDVVLMKPEIDGFKKIFNKSTHRRSDFLLIGDSQVDEVAAKKTSIDFFRVKMEYENL